MNLNKAIFFVFLGLTLALSVLFYWRVHQDQEFRQRVLKSWEAKKVPEQLMMAFSQGRENAHRDVPADGLWHHHAFSDPLIRKVLIGSRITDLRLRRFRQSPGLLDIQVVAVKNIAVVLNLRVRIP